MDEHARYGAFERQLRSDMPEDNASLERCISGAVVEPDQGTRGAMLALIANIPSMGVSQLNFLTDHVAFSEPFLQKIIFRRKLIAALDQDGPTESIFSVCLATRDDVVHRKVLSLPMLSQAQLRMLQEQGVNKAVRNIAKQRAGKSRQSKTEA